MKIFLKWSTLFWVAFSLFACPASKELPAESGSPSAAENDKIMLLMAADQHPDQLMAHFADLDLQVQGPISRSQNKYLITFDPQRIEPDKLLRQIQEFPGVSKAEFMVKNQ